MALLWRVFTINAVLLVAALVVLGLLEVTISIPAALTDAAVVAGGLAAMLVANLVLLRRTFAPLERLVRRMESVDLLRPGQRLAVRGTAEVSALVRSFNEMLDRLEGERHESARRALAAQEAERQRIARGLHDEIGQTMTAVLFQLKRVSDAAPPELREELAEAQEAVRESLDEVRRIARELRPDALDDLGLVSALIALARSFADRTGLPIERNLGHDLPDLGREAQIAIYRIAQESLTNVLRHSGASRAWLTVERSNGGVVLTVRDDGRGLEREPAPGGGLRGMHERAVLIGARLSVKNSPRGGVEVRLEVPAGEGEAR